MSVDTILLLEFNQYAKLSALSAFIVTEAPSFKLLIEVSPLTVPLTTFTVYVVEVDGFVGSVDDSDESSSVVYVTL